MGINDLDCYDLVSDEVKNLRGLLGDYKKKVELILN